MRNFGILLTALVAGPGAASAQTDVLFSPAARESIVEVEPQPEPAERLLIDEGPPAHPWSIDVLLGSETGLRVKRLLNRNRDHGWTIEGYGGLDFGVCPALGGGVRYELAPWMGRHNVISISPGAGAQALFAPSDNDRRRDGRRPSAFGLITADVDFNWRQLFTDSFSTEIGLKLGLGVPVSGPPGVLPIVSIYGGFRF